MRILCRFGHIHKNGENYREPPKNLPRQRKKVAGVGLRSGVFWICIVVRDNVVVAFPRSHPFKQSDFYPDPTFLSVDGIPVVLFPHAPVLVSYRDGKAQVVPSSILKHDNHEGLCYREFAELAYKVAKEHRPKTPQPRFLAAWPSFKVAKAADEPSAYQCSKTGDILVLGKGRAYFKDAVSGFDICMLREGEEEQLGLQDFDKAGTSWSQITDTNTAEYFFRVTLGSLWRKPSEPDLHLDHWLNQLALAMINLWSHREMPDLMPVLELALEAVPEGLADGPEGQTFDRATRSDPETVLSILEEAMQPEDLLDATNLQDAAQMTLNALSGGEITDSQLYREQEKEKQNGPTEKPAVIPPFKLTPPKPGDKPGVYTAEQAAADWKMVEARLEARGITSGF